MLISWLILGSCRVNDGCERRLTTDKGDLIGITKGLKLQNEGKKGPVAEISGFEVVEAVGVEWALSVVRVIEGCRRK
jgi:hypothetical protein